MQYNIALVMHRRCYEFIGLKYSGYVYNKKVVTLFSLRRLFVEKELFLQRVTVVRLQQRKIILHVSTSATEIKIATNRYLACKPF